MSSLGLIEKSAVEVTRADIGYTQWLTDNDRLTNVIAFVSGDNTPDNPLEPYVSLNADNTRVILMLSGGENGYDYKVIVQATAVSTQLKEVCVDVEVRGVCE